MSNLDYTKLLKIKKKKSYGNKEFICESFCYHNFFFWKIFQNLKKLVDIGWLMDG